MSREMLALIEAMRHPGQCCGVVAAKSGGGGTRDGSNASRREPKCRPVNSSLCSSNG